MQHEMGEAGAGGAYGRGELGLLLLGDPEHAIALGAFVAEREAVAHRALIGL
jgi:hypothetical protein